MDEELLIEQTKTILFEKLLKLVEDNPEKIWHWMFILLSPNLTMTVIKKDPY